MDREVIQLDDSSYRSQYLFGGAISRNRRRTIPKHTWSADPLIVSSSLDPDDVEVAAEKAADGQLMVLSEVSVLYSLDPVHLEAW